MFKRIAQKLLPGNSTKYFGRISIEYGQILSLTDCEAILFFMHPKLNWGGSLNRAVLEKAGPELDEYVLGNIHSPRTGDVFALPPFKSGYKALFMAILADWDGGNGFEERDLANCYRHAIQRAQEMGIKSLAIPALGRDKRDFPHIRFARVGLKGIAEQMDARIESVRIMCADHTMMRTYSEQLSKMKQRSSPL
jgi:O-acetyl-ADP-ribose deacetylase (regulator of RNase III)